MIYLLTDNRGREPTGVIIGAYSSREKAEKAMEILHERFGNTSKWDYDVIEMEIDEGV